MVCFKLKMICCCLFYDCQLLVSSFTLFVCLHVHMHACVRFYFVDIVYHFRYRLFSFCCVFSLRMQWGRKRERKKEIFHACLHTFQLIVWGGIEFMLLFCFFLQHTPFRSFTFFLLSEQIGATFFSLWLTQRLLVNVVLIVISSILLDFGIPIGCSAVFIRFRNFVNINNEPGSLNACWISISSFDCTSTNVWRLHKRDFNYRAHFNSSFGAFYTYNKCVRGRGKKDQNDNMNFQLHTQFISISIDK